MSEEQTGPTRPLSMAETNAALRLAAEALPILGTASKATTTFCHGTVWKLDRSEGLLAGDFRRPVQLRNSHALESATWLFLAGTSVSLASSSLDLI